MTDSVLAVVALAAPWCAAAYGAVARRRRDRAAEIATAITGLGLLAAVVLAAGAVVGGAHAVSLGRGAFALSVDALAVVMLVLVLGLSGVIQSFAVRYLRGDTRQGWFVVTANLLAGSTLVLVSAGTVLMFVAGWIAAGVSLLLALNAYPDERQARGGVRRTFRRFVLGDACLIAGALMLISIGGVDLALADVGRTVEGVPAAFGILVGLLLVAPALARSSQIPFHGWLPSTLAAPTPVSALLHAGVINAGAVLLIRFSPAMSGSALIMAVVFTAGASTVVYASVVRLTKPDVKGRLVFSTMAQMGFMIMACGLGAYAAALFHLVAHGMYKSALFLSASSGVNRAEGRRRWPERQRTPPEHRWTAIILAVVVSSGSVAGSVALLTDGVSPSSLALLGFVVLTGAVTLGAALGSRPSATTYVVGVVGISLLTLTYTASVAALGNFFGEIPATGAVPPWWVLLPAVLLIALQWVTSSPDRPTAVRDVLYARSLTAGSPATTRQKGTRHEPANQG